MAYIVLDPYGEGRTYRLSEKTGLGRDPDNRICLEDNGVSRFHVVIERTAGGTYRLTDLESANGTFVNGEPATNRLLEPGDLVEVGPYELEFHEGRPSGTGGRSMTRRLEARVTRRRRRGSARKTKLPTPADGVEAPARRDTPRPGVGTRRAERPKPTDPGPAPQRRTGSKRSEKPKRPSSSGVHRSLEGQLRALLEQFKQVFGGAGVERAEAVFAEYTDGVATSRVNVLAAQTERLFELLAINRALTTELDLQRLLAAILDAIVTLAVAEQAFLVVYDEQGNMRVEANRNLDRQTLVKPEHQVSRSIIEQVRQTGEIVHTHDALEDRRLSASLSVSNLKLRSILCIPFKVEGRVIGVLYVENRHKPEAFDADAVGVIEAFSYQAAIAIRNARQREEILEANRNLRILNQVGKAVSAKLEMDSLLELVLSKIIEITGASRTFLMLANDDGDVEFCVGRDADQQPLEEDDFEVSHEMIRLAVRARKIQRIVEHDDEELGAVVVAPMFVRRKELLGVIYADTLIDRPPISQTDADMIEQIADQAGIAIYNAQLYEKATIDSLTGVFKRSYFDQRLREEVERARRYGNPLSLLMLDLDHFKRLNDTHGHVAGDEVLRLVGRIIKSNVRGHDLPARYGGEEFAIIMPHIDLAGAVKVAKRIKNSIAGQPLLPYQLGASIGAAEFHADLPTDPSFIAAADRALYRAKETGRNKVCVWRGPAVESAER